MVSARGTRSVRRGGGFFGPDAPVPAVHCTLILADLHAEESGEPLDESPRAMKALCDRLEEYHKAVFLAAREAFLAARAYIAPEPVIPNAAQEKELIESLTSHLCRRNRCTELYYRGGVDEDTIRRLMGHELENKGEMARSHPLTEQEQYRLALQHEMTPGVYRKGGMLQYAVNEKYEQAEIPTCRCLLQIPAGERVKITITTREPFTHPCIRSFQVQVEVQEPVKMPAADSKGRPVVMAASMRLAPQKSIFEVLGGAENF